MSGLSLEDELLAELARGDAILARSGAILHHLLTGTDQALFSDEVIARVRAMMAHLARQLLMASAASEEIEERDAYAEAWLDELTSGLFEDTDLLAHVHALVLEARLAEQLRSRSGIDGVLSPLLQDLAASTDPQIAASAIAVLAAQARFFQHCQRMELPLTELPAELLHRVLEILWQLVEGSAASEATERSLRATFDEGASRLGQIARLVMAIGRPMPRALAVDHAGLGIFATALAMASGQPRSVTIIALAEQQVVRLALTLRAAGLTQQALEQQFVEFRPETGLPDGLAELSAERAGELLAQHQAQLAG